MLQGAVCSVCSVPTHGLQEKKPYLSAIASIIPLYRDLLHAVSFFVGFNNDSSIQWLGPQVFYRDIYAPPTYLSFHQPPRLPSRYSLPRRRLQRFLFYRLKWYVKISSIWPQSDAMPMSEFRTLGLYGRVERARRCGCGQ